LIIFSVILIFEYALSPVAVSKSEKNVVPPTTTFPPDGKTSAASAITSPLLTGVLSPLLSESNVSVVSCPLTSISTFLSSAFSFNTVEHPL